MSFWSRLKVKGIIAQAGGAGDVAEVQEEDIVAMQPTIYLLHQLKILGNFQPWVQSEILQNPIDISQSLQFWVLCIELSRFKNYVHDFLYQMGYFNSMP